MTKLLLFLRRTSSLLVFVLFFYTVILFNCVISCLFSGVFVLASFSFCLFLLFNVLTLIFCSVQFNGQLSIRLLIKKER